MFGRATIASMEKAGGYEMARELLVTTVGLERAEEIMSRVAATMVELPFHTLHTLDPRQIVSVLSDEHPQIIAMVLAHLPATLAAQVLTSLPAALQATVAHRIAVMDRTSPELIRNVENGLERRLSTFGVSSTLSAVGGVRPLVEIINRADRSTERLILEGLEERDPSLALEVRNEMFTFEDIASLDDRAIQLVLRQVPPSELAPALKGVKESVRTKLMQNLSERAALDLAEELEMLGPVRISVVEEAQDKVIAMVRDLEASGQIVISRGDKDQFVA
jgi:flagellar motor switch protein FliG